MIEEYDYLNIQYKNLRNEFTNKTILKREVNNYDRIINYLQKSLNEKFNNIKAHSNKRQKRGLINGLGSIVKSITGNLDADDGKRYDKILNHMQSNMKNFENQLNLQYSINDEIIKKFNATIKDIQHNDLVLKSRIIQLHSLIQDKYQQQDILFAKDIYNQLIILYNTVLNVLQDIENSITFCKLQTLHPSIVKTVELFQELQKISKFYKNQLPFELTYENMINFESIIKVNCKIEPNQILFFLNLPIDFEQTFDLYYLKSIPTKHESEYVTIFPDTRYLLRSENEVVPLREICTNAAIFQCPNQLILRTNISCEKEILQHSDPKNCHYTKLKIKENQLDFVFEINQYLGVFPKEEKIITQCKGQTETRKLNGIFLFKRDNCKLLLNNEEINYNEKTYGTPSIISGFQLKINRSKISNFSLELKSLKLEDISNPRIINQNMDEPMIHTSPSIWTIIIYIAIPLTVCALIAQKIKKQKMKKTSIQDKKPEEPRLPEEALFQQGRSYLTNIADVPKK